MSCGYDDIPGEDLQRETANGGELRGEQRSLQQSQRNTNQRDSEAMQEHQIRPPGWHFSDGTAE